MKSYTVNDSVGHVGHQLGVIASDTAATSRCTETKRLIVQCSGVSMQFYQTVYLNVSVKRVCSKALYTPSYIINFRLEPIVVLALACSSRTITSADSGPCDLLIDLSMMSFMRLVAVGFYLSVLFVGFYQLPLGAASP